MVCLLKFLKEEAGATAVEYAVMLALILLACVGAIKVLGDSSDGMWGNNYSQLKANGF
ncbi:MAG: Flp family type IVb pilin [Planctomycetota bacterium]|nr:MAG: Flp family type IVb pilin [Planctomycetota bacterium]REJ96786.1 MAG: Flp family type IVb pilin [Planctomycetota bacterium]REK21034.1 MAG: Flp family type IVb pilin [Planctomycetota bacterium]REK38852.1 MAG: Flp family type IVb pilin [Planctomycetota bacterium]